LQAIQREKSEAHLALAGISAARKIDNIEMAAMGCGRVKLDLISDECDIVFARHGLCDVFLGHILGEHITVDKMPGQSHDFEDVQDQPHE
jgi:hypothetical protein